MSVLVPAHFAERFGLIIILALGESIVVLGVGADVGLTAGVILAAVLGVALSSALWWTYFDIVAIVTEQRLASMPSGREQNLQQVGVAVLLVALAPIATQVPSLVALAGVSVVLWTMTAYETRSNHTDRTQLRRTH